MRGIIEMRIIKEVREVITGHECGHFYVRWSEDGYPGQSLEEEWKYHSLEERYKKLDSLYIALHGGHDY
jgi:hypothetical protein